MGKKQATLKQISTEDPLSSKKTIEKVVKRKVASKAKGPNASSHTGQEAVKRLTPDTTDPDFSYDPSFLSEEEQTNIIDNLNKLDWQKVTYTKFGKPRSTPRHTFCFGTPSGQGEPVDVCYNGFHYMTEKIPEFLDVLKQKVEKQTGFTYNAIILNNYITEGEYISWHTDDERFLAHTTVASISLGAVRTFKVRRSPYGAICKMQCGTGKKKVVKDENGDELSMKDMREAASETAVTLESGSLSVLFHGIEHALPQETPVPHKGMTNRYNITFRCLKPFKTGEKMSGWGNYYHYNRGSKYQIESKGKKVKAEPWDKE